MKKIKITAFADTHTQHNKITQFLPGGDILICAGDFTGRGFREEIKQFCEWFDKIPNYNLKIFIAGNHELGLQDNYQECMEVIKQYPNIIYLQDDLHLCEDPGVNYEDMLKIYGTPWQPEFFNWAFNLPRGEAIKEKWDLIPMNTDILITHGPPFGKLDVTSHGRLNVGCEELLIKIKEIKPKINIFGHVHESHGYVFDGETHYLNVAVLDGRYTFKNKPVTFEWDKETNEIIFL